MYLAWWSGCDYVMTLDDDCYPEPEGGVPFVERHLAAFARDRWFRPILGDEVRGIPYERLGRMDVRMNQGLWSIVPDLDAPTSLVRLRSPTDYLARSGHEVVPRGMAFPLSAMNVCYHRSLLPAAYNLLMGPETGGFDRFDDIWSGLLLKRILDYMAWSVTVGEPLVRHLRKSSPFVNLRKEALGIAVHERIWDYILDTPLSPGLSVTGAYAALAHHLNDFPRSSPDTEGYAAYFSKLAAAMVTWTELFDRADQSRL